VKTKVMSMFPSMLPSAVAQGGSRRGSALQPPPSPLAPVAPAAAPFKEPQTPLLLHAWIDNETKSETTKALHEAFAAVVSVYNTPTVLHFKTQQTVRKALPTTIGCGTALARIGQVAVVGPLRDATLAADAVTHARNAKSGFQSSIERLNTALPALAETFAEVRREHDLLLKQQQRLEDQRAADLVAQQQPLPLFEVPDAPLRSHGSGSGSSLADHAVVAEAAAALSAPTVQALLSAPLTASIAQAVADAREGLDAPYGAHGELVPASSADGAAATDPEGTVDQAEGQRESAPTVDARDPGDSIANDTSAAALGGATAAPHAHPTSEGRTAM
jgi:hypothetical protein